MNTKIAISLMSCIFVSSSAFAEVVIQVPDTVTILVANGTKPELSGGVFDSGKTLHLQDGLQQIVFRYTPYFQKGQNNIGVESEVTIAKFEASHQKLSLTMPHYHNLKEAQAHIKSMNWSITNEDGQAISLTNDQLVKEGIQFGRNFYTEMTVYNQSDKRASVPAFAPGKQQLRTMSTVPVHNPTTTGNAPSVKAMLHYWYDQADEQTKQTFKDYVNQK